MSQQQQPGAPDCDGGGEAGQMERREHKKKAQLHPFPIQLLKDPCREEATKIAHRKGSAATAELVESLCRTQRNRT